MFDDRRRNCGEGDGSAEANAVVGVVLDVGEYSVLSSGVGDVTNDSVSESGLSG